jgi:hypothetical protein
VSGLVLSILPDSLNPADTLNQCLGCLANDSTNGHVKVASAQSNDSGGLNDLNGWMSAASIVGVKVAPFLETRGKQSPSIALVEALLNDCLDLLPKYPTVWARDPKSGLPIVYFDSITALPPTDWLSIDRKAWHTVGNCGLPFTANTTDIDVSVVMPYWNAKCFDGYYNGEPAGGFSSELIDEASEADIEIKLSAWGGVNRLGTLEYTDAHFTQTFRDTWADALYCVGELAFDGVHLVVWDPSEGRKILGNPALTDLCAAYACQLAAKPFPYSKPRTYLTTATPALPQKEVLTIAKSGVTATMVDVPGVTQPTAGTRETYVSERTS